MSSSPAPSPWQSATQPGRAERLQRARRLLDHVSLIAVFAIIAVVVVASFVLGREGLTAQPAVAKLGLDRALRSRGFAVGPTAAMKARSAPGTSGIDASLFERLFPALVAPHHSDVALGPVVAREPVALLERADRQARVVTTLEPGEVVHATKQSGDWLLIQVKQGKQLLFGWTLRDRVEPVQARLPGGR